MKSLNILKPIDEFVNKQLETLKSSTEYQKVTDMVSSLEDKQIVIIKAVLMSLVFAIPILIILIFSSFNSSLKDELAMKEKIIKSSKTIISLKENLKKEERKTLSEAVESESSFKSKITRSLSRIGIDASKIQVSNFSLNDEDGSISQVQADISFLGFSSQNIYDFFEKVIIPQKIRVEELEIKKDQATNLLTGVASIYYFSKVPVEEGY